jgi:hypothetical protein
MDLYNSPERTSQGKHKARRAIHLERETDLCVNQKTSSSSYGKKERPLQTRIEILDEPQITYRRQLDQIQKR